MTFSQILREAHAVARRERGFHSSYREAFAEGMKCVYATLRAAPVTTGFHVVEPWYKRTVFEPRGAGHRVVR